MLIPKIGHGKALVLLGDVFHRKPKLGFTIIEPVITKDIRLQWLAKLNPKMDTYQRLKENILKGENKK